MILTITINPLLERRYSYKKVDLDINNRDGKEEINIGGKGINVSRQLNHLNTDNFAFTFHGGLNGKLLKESLKKEGINFTSLHTASETRECAVIMDLTEKRTYTFFASNSAVTADESAEFKSKMEKMIENCEIAVFSGSSPCDETDDIFPYGIELANKFDKISICDTYGRQLKKCLEKVPTVIHNNIDEIEKSLGVSLKSEEQKIDYLNRLYKNGTKQVYLTDGGRPAYASNFDFHYKIDNPSVVPVDSTGSGDSFVAGIAYGWHNNLTFTETLKLASCLGAVNASEFEVCKVKEIDLQPLLNKVKITPLGKKMKTLDVTPR